MAFDRAHEVAIGRGENRGRTLRYRNVVRAILDLGSWDGSASALPAAARAARSRAPGRRVAVLVQRKADGAILAALRIDLAPG